MSSRIHCVVAIIKTVGHYAFLVLVVYSAIAYWIVTTGDSFSRQRLDDDNLGMNEPAASLLGVVLHPVFSYALLVLCLTLVAKEFFVESLRKRFGLNLAGFAVVCLFLGVFQFWVFNRL